MRPRRVVLLNPVESVHPFRLPSYQQPIPVSPLFPAAWPLLAKSAHLPHSTTLSFPLFSYVCALFFTFENANSCVFKRSRALAQKTRGCLIQAKSLFVCPCSKASAIPSILFVFCPLRTLFTLLPPSKRRNSTGIKRFRTLCKTTEGVTSHSEIHHSPLASRLRQAPRGATSPLCGHAQVLPPPTRSTLRCVPMRRCAFRRRPFLFSVFNFLFSVFWLLDEVEERRET